MDLGTFLQWLVGGGAVALVTLAIKLHRDIRQIKVETAKAEADRQQQRAKESQFAGVIAESGTKIAGETMWQTLMRTLADREEKAQAMAQELRTQQTSMFELVSKYREEMAELREREAGDEREIAELQAEVKKLRAQGIRLSRRVQQSGGALTSTDFYGDK